MASKIDARKLEELKKLYGNPNRVTTMKPGPIYGGAPVTPSAVPVGGSYTPQGAVLQGKPYAPNSLPAIRTAGGLPQSPLQAVATDAAFTEAAPVAESVGERGLAISNKALVPIAKQAAQKGAMRQLGGMALSAPVSVIGGTIQASRPIGNMVAENTKQALPVEAITANTDIRGTGKDMYMQGHVPPAYQPQFASGEVTRSGAPLTREAAAKQQDVLGSRYAANRLREPDAGLPPLEMNQHPISQVVPPTERPYTPALVPEHLREKQEVAVPEAKPYPRQTFDPSQLNMVKDTYGSAMKSVDSKHAANQELLQSMLNSRIRTMPAGFNPLGAIAGARQAEALAGGIVGSNEEAANDTLSGMNTAIPAMNTAYKEGDALRQAQIGEELKTESELDKLRRSPVTPALIKHYEASADSNKMEGIKGRYIEELLAREKTPEGRSAVLNRLLFKDKDHVAVDPKQIEMIDNYTDPAALKRLIATMDPNDPHAVYAGMTYAALNKK